MPRFSTLTRSTTLRLAGAVATLVVTAPVGVPARAASSERPVEVLQCSKAKSVSGYKAVWQRFPQPYFEPGLGLDDVSQKPTSYAVSPANAKLLAITNGNAVYLSRNGGCDWTLGVRLDRAPGPQIPLSGLVTTIRSVHITSSGAVFALAEELETGATVGRPHILRSPTGRINTWSLADSGLPPVGKPLMLRGHRTNPDVVYVTFAGAREESTCPPEPLPCDESLQGQRLGLMYRSTDGGVTWASRTDPQDLNSVSAIKYFSVDDDDPQGNKVWVVANKLLRLSTNGGLSYTAPDGLDQSGFEFTAVESLGKGPKSDGLEVVAFSATSEMIRLHRGRWIRSSVPFPSVESVTQRPEGDIAVATSPGQGGVVYAWRIYPRDFFDYEQKIGLGGKVFRQSFGWEDISPNIAINVPAMAGAGASTTTSYAGTVYLRYQAGVLRFIKSVKRLPEDPVAPTDLGPLDPPRGTISPRSLDIDIPVGKSTVVDYELKLPPAPTPIDVYLLVDNSGSMQPTITSLKESLAEIARSLYRSGVDIAIGVGQINVEPSQQHLPYDDPRTPQDDSIPKPLYEKLRGVGPVDASLFQSLKKLDGNGGAGKEAQLEALYQAVTGDGVSFANLGIGWLTGYDVKPGQHAEFRDEMTPVKVIVHATDEPFSTDLRVGHKDIASVARALRTAGVKQFGLSQGVLPDPTDPDRDAYEDLAEMAALTGAVAPAGGTDCDGDGRIGSEDVKPGRPLVCTQSSGLDTTLVNLIRSLKDRQVIHLDYKASAAMKQVTVTDFPIDAKQETVRTFTVTYSCKGLADGAYENEIVASLRGLKIASASAQINCGGKRDPAPVTVPVEPAVNPPPPQPQPIVPAPAPVNPVAQTQVQTQVNPQAGSATQEEEEFALATAQNDVTREDGEQLAMTALSYADNPAVVMAFGMAFASMLATGMALRRRTRTATARVTVRR